MVCGLDLPPEIFDDLIAIQMVDRLQLEFYRLCHIRSVDRLFLKLVFK
jgi:hypothetical protein